MFKNLVNAFEYQVSQTPKKIAVEFKDKLISYEELNIKVNSLANYLVNEKGIEPGDIIPLLLDRNENVIVAMLAVLKIGAAYTTLTKQYPKARIDFVLEQTNAKMIIDDTFMAREFKEYKSNLNISISPKSKAYIVYTSGTTGNPKGVIHTHRSTYDHIDAFSKFMSIGEYKHLNMLFLVNFVFSVATTQIYTALLHGHKLVISDPDSLENIEQFTQYINDKEINYFQSTPSLADSLEFSQLNELNIIGVAGEKLSRSLVENANQNNIKLVNVYGQSEFHSTTAKVINSVKDINNIGSALKNMKVYVLDENLNEVSIGEIGEICVEGKQLAEGYLNQVEETERHFIDSPFTSGKLCKTGDLARKLKNNEFEFIGRNDFQLNINGIRTEPAEIEAHINKVPGVENSVVVGYKDQFIVAYYVSDNEISDKVIKTFISNKLPDYMQPHVYVWLKKLPLNDNGKLDRTKLPKIDLSRKKLVRPTNDYEKVLVNSIGELLSISDVSVSENFFELGGTSLQAMKLANTVMKKTNKKLTTKDILGNLTIQELASILQKQKSETEDSFVQVIKEKVNLMSPAQKRTFVLYEIDKNRTNYNEQTVLDFFGKIDVEALKDALIQMISKHESLRTKFYNKNGEYFQEVLKKGMLDFKIVSQITDYCSLVEPFDLESGSTMHIRLVRGRNKDSLFIDKHHIITDKTSEEIFYKELATLYRGKSIKLNQHHYKDYSYWINHLDLTNEKKWWLNYLTGYQRLELATDYKDQKSSLSMGKTKVHSFSKELVSEIRNFSKNNRVSDYVLLFTTISVLLSKMYNSKDFVLGTIANGRVHEATENMLGMFVNTLPIRVNIDAKQTAQQFLEDMNENILSALSNQNYQFESIAKDLDATNEGKTPFFDCMFVYQDTRYQNYFEGLAKKNSYKTSAPKFSLTFEIEDSGHSMDIYLNYDESLFKESTIERLYKNFLNTLEDYIANPQKSVSDLSALSKKDRDFLLESRKPTEHENVITLIEQQADKIPNSIALQFKEHSLTYAELDNEVNKLANYLISERNVGVEQKIPLLLQRSEKMIIAILGVLKAGAAYVPVSPKYPQDRIDYIIDACKSSFIIDDDFMRTKFPEDTRRPRVKINKNNLAYIIFTSGTTGKPKGVMVEHGNLSNFVVEVSRMPHSGMTPGIINGAFFDYVFDASIHDLIRPFTMGESVVMLDTNLIYDVDKFIRVLAHYRINAIGMTPSLAGKLDLSRVPSMKFIHCGGEVITTEVIDKYTNTNIQINNCYGPTETTILSFVNNDVKDLSIGKPISGVYPFVLDDEKQLSPFGAVGNLYIGGNQVTRGYLNQPEETKKRYLVNPFGEGLIYDTGDLVRRLENGSYEYYGRKDQQVKIRGFRIELTEVEKQLQTIQDINQVAIIVHKENLVAYYTSSKTLDPNSINEYLNKHLPSYMIPIAYMHIKEIPVTINGKLDKKRLPKPQYTKKNSVPVTIREKEISSAVCKVLELPQVSVDEDFFRMGGNSIAAISLANMIDIQVRDIFEQKTIRNLAKVKRKNLKVEKQQFEDETEQILSYAQERLFYIDQLEGSSEAYNVPMEITLHPKIDLDRLELAIRKVVDRHEILRTIIAESFQKTLEDPINITHEAINCVEFFSYKFDLTKEIPIRVNIFDYVLSINVHHIAFDGWSTNIFLKEIANIYAGCRLPDLEVQYKDYAKWQRIIQDKKYLADQKDYWIRKLSDYETLDFPTDFSRPIEFDYVGKELIYEFNQD